MSAPTFLREGVAWFDIDAVAAMNDLTPAKLRRLWEAGEFPLPLMFRRGIPHWPEQLATPVALAEHEACMKATARKVRLPASQREADSAAARETLAARKARAAAEVLARAAARKLARRSKTPPADTVSLPPPSWLVPALALRAPDGIIE